MGRFSHHLCCVLVVAFYASPATGQEIHCKHFFYGYPTGTPATNDLIIRDCYALSSNDEKKFVDWVAYRLTPQETFGTLDLDRDWHTNPWLEATETLEAKGGGHQDDYKGANAAHTYDRGHMAPLGSFKGSRHASQVNFYSNITPQKHALNNGAWKHLEESVRDLVDQYKVVWVMTGALYESTADQLPQADEDHTVPSGFWKIVAVETGGSIKVAGFVFGQDTASNAKLIDHVKTVDDIEQRSGLDFLRLLPDAEDVTIETGVSSDWVEEEFRE